MRILLFFAMLLLLLNTVSAYQQVDMGRVKQSSFTVPQGYVIFSVYANDIPFKPNEEWTTQTFILDSFDQKYTLTVKGRAEGLFGVYKHFYINLTYPNGTVVSKELNERVLSINDFDIKIQYYATEFDFIYELDVFIQLDPFDASFNAPSEKYKIEELIPFSKVYFISDQEAHLKLYYTTYEHWQEIKDAYESGDWLAIIGLQGEHIGNLVNELKEAAKNIPGAGMVIETFDSLYFIFSGGLYYIKLIFVDNGLLTFALFEAFALAFAAGTSRDFYAFVRKYINWHVALFEFALGIVRTFVDIVSKVVQALKPI